MDDDTKNRIINDINPARGFRSELERVINESSMGDKNKDYEASENQVRAIRDRMTTHDNYKSYKFELHGNTYIRLDDDNYKQVTEKDDVLRTSDGNVFIRNAEGQAHKKIAEEHMEDDNNEE